MSKDAMIYIHPGARATFSTVWIHFECKYRFIVVSNTVQSGLGGFIPDSRSGGEGHM